MEDDEFSSHKFGRRQLTGKAGSVTVVAKTKRRKVSLSYLFTADWSDKTNVGDSGLVRAWGVRAATKTSKWPSSGDNNYNKIDVEKQYKIMRRGAAVYHVVKRSFRRRRRRLGVCIGCLYSESYSTRRLSKWRGEIFHVFLLNSHHANTCINMHSHFYFRNGVPLGQRGSPLAHFMRGALQFSVTTVRVDRCGNLGCEDSRRSGACALYPAACASLGFGTSGAEGKFNDEH